MAKEVDWSVELKTREEVLTVRTILHDLPSAFSGPLRHPRMEFIDQRGRKHVFDCTEEELERIRNGARNV